VTRDLLDNRALGVPSRAVVFANVQGANPFRISVEVFSFNVHIVHATCLSLSGETIPLLLPGTHAGGRCSGEYENGVMGDSRFELGPRPGKLDWLVE
jgi:hypothetical protein